MVLVVKCDSSEGATEEEYPHFDTIAQEKATQRRKKRGKEEEKKVYFFCRILFIQLCNHIVLKMGLPFFVPPEERKLGTIQRTHMVVMEHK